MKVDEVCLVYLRRCREGSFLTVWCDDDQGMMVVKEKRERVR